jgi:adenine/guanine phosphoribosyltransferase-like PRPP-binding protein
MVDKPLRIMLLTTPQTYRTEAFIKAANKLGIEIVKAMDMPKRLTDKWKMRQGTVAIEPFDFSQPELAVSEIVIYAKKRPITAILAVDDAGAVLAAMASQALGLPHNAIEAADAARNKYIMRQMLEYIMRQMLDAGNVASPPFRPFSMYGEHNA